MNVLVIPEDFRKDQYMLKPIVERMFKGFGHNAHVRVCMDPLLGGVGEALKWERIEEILDRYKGMVRVFLLLVDRDGQEGRRQRLDRLEEKAAKVLSEEQVFLGENAWQEIEVWVLAGLQDLPKKWAWAEIRAHLHPKETYYMPHAEARGVARGALEGRDTLAKEAASNYTRIRQLCPEDVARLESRLRAALAA